MRNRWLLIVATLFCLITAFSVRAETVNAPSILVIGDSLSAEYGLRRDSGWVNLVQQRLQESGFKHHINNASISGDTTSGGLSRFPAALERYKPAIVIIELGSNDALRGLPLEMTRRNLEKMVDMALAQKANVVLVGMQIPPNYGRQYTEAFKSLFTEIATARKTALVPFLFEGIATDRSLFQADGIHPNETAQPVLASNVWQALAPLLK